jgi:hypothetical protein
MIMAKLDSIFIGRIRPKLKLKQVMKKTHVYQATTDPFTLSSGTARLLLFNINDFYLLLQVRIRIMHGIL